jgi:hypothetical protein
MTRVDQAGLRESLQPPASLVLGHQDPVGCLFIGDRAEHPYLVARHRQPEGQVGILGDVERVPGTAHGDTLAVAILEFPPAIGRGDGLERLATEMIARAPERRDKTEPRHAREHPLEVGHVLGPVKRADPASARVPEDEPGLQASDARAVRWNRTKTGYRLEQLIWFRAVLGVEDRYDLAGGVSITVVAGLRLGARARVRRDEDLEVTGQVHRRRGGPGFVVVLFQQQQDLQLLGRVAQAGQRLRQLADDVGFAVERHQDGVARESRVIFRREVIVGIGRFRRGVPDDALEAHEDDVERDAESDGHLEEKHGPEGGRDHDGQQEHDDAGHLLAGTQQPRRGLRLVQPVHGFLTS